ncbi:MAG: ATP-binding protein [Planctomycetota bacterium]
MLLNTKILAIYREDENMNASVKLLEDKGYDVFSETCIFQAISTATEKRVDTIILDIDNLELKDIEFIDVVRKTNANLFILISFSNSNREKAFKYIERGADCYILKPFYIKELFAIVRRFSDKISRNGSVLKESNKTHKSIEHLALRIAHEINNPLTSIYGQLQLRLSQIESDSSDFQVFSTFEEETRRIADTVRDLVTYSQLKDPEKKAVDLNGILKGIISSFKNKALEGNVQVVESFEEDLPMIMADKEQITLVCKNIIDNSRRAISGKGGLKIATKKGADNFVNATFYDSGRGIPSDVIKSIFDPFFVVNEEERGMGLGLCVSNDIIKRHGGALTVRSQLDKGTIFQFALPIGVN